MTKAKMKDQPSLLPDDAPEPKMKDVTPPKKTESATLPITEGMVRKGGRNQGPSQVKERPKPPAAINVPKATKGQVAALKRNNAVAIADPERPKSVLQIIAEAASNPAVNPENMRALLDMQKEIVAEERKQTFDAAFIALQAELPVINKDGKIEIRKDGKLLQTTPYASFENIMDAIQPFLTKHGFGLSFETASAGDRLLVRGHLIGHGHERNTEFPLPAEASGSKNNVQGWGSTLSYGKRYATIALLNIRSRALQDADTDGAVGDFKRAKGGGMVDVAEPPKVSPAQVEELREMIEWCGIGEPAFLRHYEIQKIADLPADLFAGAQKNCKNYHANQKGKAAHG